MRPGDAGGALWPQGCVRRIEAVELDLRKDADLRSWAESWNPFPHVAVMLIVSIGGIVAKKQAALTSNAKMRHIVDLLTADYMAGSAWIDRVDEQGRPLKLRCEASCVGEA